MPERFMIWLTIIGAIVAQAIVVVLIIEYIDRRGKVIPTQPPKAEEETQKEEAPEVEPEEKVVTVKQEVTEEVVGKSLFTTEQFKAMLAEVVKPMMEECIEKALDLREIEFDHTKKEEKGEKREAQEALEDDKRMTAEQESRVWEDHRDEEDRLDKEDNDPVPPNPLASGADFDQIAAATDTLENPESHSVQEITVAVKIIHGLNGTEFTGCLPDSLFERLQQFHQMADKKRAAEETMNSEKVKEVSKPNGSRAAKETDTKEPTKDSNQKDWSEVWTLMEEIREHSQKFRNQ